MFIPVNFSSRMKTHATVDYKVTSGGSCRLQWPHSHPVDLSVAICKASLFRPALFCMEDSWFTHAFGTGSICGSFVIMCNVICASTFP